MLSLGPDPGTDIAILRAPEISTLRTFAMIDSSECVFTQDNRENSVINGFSNIGGLWTFISGIFAAVFGSSLMRVGVVERMDKSRDPTRDSARDSAGR